jgi:hypothetical protein
MNVKYNPGFLKKKLSSFAIDYLIALQASRSKILDFFCCCFGFLADEVLMLQATNVS